MKLYDLSHPLCEEMPVYPGDAPTRILRDHDLLADGYETHVLSLSLHSGTHLDVPRNLLPDARAVASYSLERFCGPAVLLDCRNASDSIHLTAPQLSAVTPGCCVLLLTGFDRFYGEESYFSSHPRLSEASCQALVEKRISLLGFDMPSPDHAPFSIHRALLEADILLLENLKGLSSLLGQKNIFLSCFPLALPCEASPVRAVAFVE